MFPLPPLPDVADLAGQDIRFDEVNRCTHKEGAA